VSTPRLRRPFVTLKLATSLDGKIALANGQSEWITSERSRLQGRMLRGQHDAIAVGGNTAVVDNPQLTTRIMGQADPQRVIFDSRLRLLVEGGGILAASFLRLGIVDRIDWFRAPIILGADGRSAVGDLGIEAMSDVFKLPRVHLSELGDDIYERYQRIEM